MLCSRGTFCLISLVKMVLFPQKAVPGDKYPSLHPLCDPQVLVLCVPGGPGSSWAAGSWPEEGGPAGDMES